MSRAWEIGVASDARHRGHMEDRCCHRILPDGVFAGVFDGHGGDAVAETAAREAWDCYAAAGAGADEAPADRWPRTFERLEALAGREECGAAAVLVRVTERTCDVAWTGDSRAVLARRDGGHEVTTDHRVSNPEERRRVLAAGARIEGVYVYSSRDRFGPGLMLTRSLGDRSLRQAGVIPVPEARRWPMDGAAGLVLATDGLWDVVEAREAADVVRRAPSAQAAAAALVELVAKRDGADNVMVLVIRPDGG